MSPNRHMVLPMDFFEDAAQVLPLPRGVLLDFAVNPFNGNIVVGYQDNPCARFFIRLVLEQLAGYDDLFNQSVKDTDVRVMQEV